MTGPDKDAEAHYSEIAKEYGKSKLATMQDEFRRELEIDQLLAFFGDGGTRSNENRFGLKICPRNMCRRETYIDRPFRDSPLKVLEAGCGNGYAAGQIVNELKSINIEGIDLNTDMVNIAQDRNLDNATFSVGDVRDLDFDDNFFDAAYTERCLINLDSWEEQKSALNEIARVLRPNGDLLLIESFIDGLENLNNARLAVGLDPINEPWFDRFLKYDELENYLACENTNFELIDPTDSKYDPNFMSTYDFGSRVIYPVFLATQKDAKLEYNTKFVEFFKFLPPWGDFGPIKALLLNA